LSKLSMTFACGLYDRMIALRTGEVQPEGIDLNFINIDNPRELFDRMVGKLEFDASEMSSSEYVARFAAGDCPFVALPVFPSRVFRHGYIAVDRRVIRSPKDLAGRRIGRVHPRADHRGLVAHHVDAVEERCQRVGVTDIDPKATGRGFAAGAVRGGQHHVDADDVVAARRQRVQ